MKRIQEWKEVQIQILKEIQTETPNATFWAEGYCPSEGEPDEDTNENGQYWTEWHDLTAEELLDKLKDDRYDIEDWDEEEQVEQEINKCDYTWRVEPCEQTDFENLAHCVETDNLKENSNNRWYCPMHQSMVDEINKKRFEEWYVKGYKEGQGELKENINKELNETIILYQKDLFHIGKKLSEDISLKEFLKLRITEANKLLLECLKEKLKNGYFV